MVTDHVDHVDADGIVLESGRRIDADVIVTATGLQLQSLGGATISVDGEKVDPHDRFLYRRHMLEDVPNAASCVGYTNASWTLGADLTAQSFAKLLAYMNSHGYSHAYPHLGDVNMPEQPAFNLDSGYVKRGLHMLPKSGTRRPWMLSHNSCVTYSAGRSNPSTSRWCSAVRLQSVSIGRRSLPTLTKTAADGATPPGEIADTTDSGPQPPDHS